MRQKKAVKPKKRGRAIPILVAAGIGYLIGSWNVALVRGREPSGSQSATQTIALRFPQALGEFPVTQAAAYQSAAAASAAIIMQRARLALFDPKPMLQASAASAPAPAQAAAAAPEPKPSQEEVADLSPVPPAPGEPEIAAPILPHPNALTSAAKPHPAPAPARREAKRPGYLLTDAQIADIKRRLHLTPDQEQMWPAVAAALRNIGAASEREARWRGTPGGIDPDSPQVQDLKSAAIPLLMSFSDEQKDEVRNLARRMGLDQLASEF